MRVSEKSLELNVGAELLGLIRNQWNMPKAYLRGLTQREERQEGPDFFAQLSPSAFLFAFQFKAPRGGKEGTPYRYKLVRQQHARLRVLAQAWPSSVFYVFPFYVTPVKLQRDVPNLLEDTWLLRVAQVSTAAFGHQQTTIIRCEAGVALINPEYKLENPATVSPRDVEGIPARRFAAWYRQHRAIGRQPGRRRSPWLVRGLRLVVVEPEPSAS
jgi:hypothetical protein